MMSPEYSAGGRSAKTSTFPVTIHTATSLQTQVRSSGRTSPLRSAARCSTGLTSAVCCKARPDCVHSPRAQRLGGEIIDSLFVILCDGRNNWVLIPYIGRPRNERHIRRNGEQISQHAPGALRRGAAQD